VVVVEVVMVVNGRERGTQSTVGLSREKGVDKEEATADKPQRQATGDRR
jgi:hypothetical protein